MLALDRLVHSCFETGGIATYQVFRAPADCTLTHTSH
jgi:hypothetical protein